MFPAVEADAHSSGFGSLSVSDRRNGIPRRIHSPVHSGGRFSTKAFAPSWASLLASIFMNAGHHLVDDPVRNKLVGSEAPAGHEDFEGFLPWQQLGRDCGRSSEAGQ